MHAKPHFVLGTGIFLLPFRNTACQHLSYLCNHLSVQEEIKARSPIQVAQAKYGSVFEADKIAGDICSGIERGSFLISHGFDGLLLKIITAGMSPVYHWCTAITEVCVLIWGRPRKTTTCSPFKLRYQDTSLIGTLSCPITTLH